MKLPGAERAVVEPAKVRDYLLAPGHLVGGAKARVFAALGFTQANWREFQGALLEVARTGDAERGPATRFGQKYVIRATIQGPGGRRGAIVTVWIVLLTEDFPRLVTAYPAEGLP